MPDLPLDAHLLVVDDDPITCDVLDGYLRHAGFSFVQIVHSGRAALRAITAETPDLILLDVMMPGLSGYQITERIRKDHPDRYIPIILISALMEPQERARGIRAGANDFITKPIDNHELIARVTSFLNYKQVLDQLKSERTRLSILYSISQAFNQIDYERIISKIVSLTTEHTGAAKAILVPLDEQGRFRQRYVSRRGEDTYSASEIDPDVLTRGLLGWVLQHAQPVLIADTRHDKRWAQLEDDTEPAGSAIAVPLVRSDQVVGALLLISPDTGAFNPEQLELLDIIGSHAVIALENARLFDQARGERARAEALLNQIGNPVLVTDPKGNIARINPAAEQVFKLNSECIGQPLGKVFNLTLADLLLRAKERGQAVSGEFTSRLASDGTERAFNVSISPIEEVGYMLVWQDITGIKESARVRLESERAETQRIRDAFSRYMSTTLMERVLDDRDILSRRERREAIVLFADLRGFTRLTVEHQPDTVISLLNDYFTEMMEIIDRHEGLVFDITGDEVMAGFNVPYDQNNLNHRALTTAIAMQRRFAQLKARWASQRIEVGLGIGINRGAVVLGHIGGRAQMTYSMVGQTINLGHRMVEIAEDAQIIVGPELLADGLPADAGVEVEELPPMPVKGRKELQQMILLRVKESRPRRKTKRERQQVSGGNS